MNKEEVISMVEKYILQSQGGQSVEDNKFDFKTNLYNLDDNYGTNKFIKDTSAIANTIGSDGAPVIGYDD